MTDFTAKGKDLSELIIIPIGCETDIGPQIKRGLSKLVTEKDPSVSAEIAHEILACETLYVMRRIVAREGAKVNMRMGNEADFKFVLEAFSFAVEHNSTAEKAMSWKVSPQPDTLRPNEVRCIARGSNVIYLRDRIQRAG